MTTVQQKIIRRLNWYRGRFQVNNPIVGRAIEILGDRVRMDGLTYSVATPQITRGHKSTLAFGLHEMEERALIRRWMPRNLPVLEFGGGLGVVSCLANSKLLDPKKHIVVEANPAMIPILEQNRDLNNRQFQILNKAIAYDCDQVELNVDSEFVGSSVKDLSFEKTALVQATTVRQLLDQSDFDRAGIICDIEGVESDIISREMAELASRIDFIMAEMHPNILGAAVVSNLLHYLLDIGFSLKQKLGDCVFLSR
jgi:FkbM family methyltransferase